MLIVDVSEIELPGEAKQNNLPPKYGQLIDGGENHYDACHLVFKNYWVRGR
jgi:hypothetical protein